MDPALLPDSSEAMEMFPHLRVQCMLMCAFLHVGACCTQYHSQAYLRLLLEGFYPSVHMQAFPLESLAMYSFSSDFIPTHLFQHHFRFLCKLGFR